MKLGTKLEGIIRNVFRYRAIADLSRDPNGGQFKTDVIKGVVLCLSCSNLQNDVEQKEISSFVQCEPYC